MDYQEQIVSTVKKVLPAVVSIAIAKELEVLESELPLGPFGMDPYTDAIEEQLRHAPRDEKGRIQLGGGSGFIVSPGGIVMTNKHVVLDPNASYSVILANNKKHEAEILARDPINDIAILKIKAEDLPFIELGDSRNVELGQTVIAIGNALGQFQNSVSTGIISGLSRLITAITDAKGHQQRLRGLIQTDAAINPGNSGGPLVDLAGDAVGINAAVVFGAQNIGFALPIDQAKKDLEEIKKFGRIRRPLLGVRYVLLNKQLQEKFHLPASQGALVVNEGLPGDRAVIAGSAADKGGVKEFDVILKCGDKAITEEETLEDILSSFAIGDKISLTLLRKGKEMNASVVLEEFKQIA